MVTITVSAGGVCSVLDGSHDSVSPWCVQCPGWLPWQCQPVVCAVSWMDGYHDSVSPWCVQCPGWMVTMTVSARGVCSVLDGWLP